MPCTVDELIAAHDAINLERPFLQTRGLSTGFLERHIMGRLRDLDPHLGSFIGDNDSLTSDTECGSISRTDSGDFGHTRDIGEGESTPKRKRDVSDDGTGEPKLPKPNKLVRSARKNSAQSMRFDATAPKPEEAQDIATFASKAPKKLILEEGRTPPSRYSLRQRKNTSQLFR